MNKKNLTANIRKPFEYFDEGKLITISEEERNGTNCYAAALGITKPKKIGYYYPGFTNKKSFNDYNIVESILNDCENLGYKARKIELTSPYTIEEGEHLVKLFFVQSDPDTGSDATFHFLVRDPISGKWFGKDGYNDLVSHDSEPMAIWIDCPTYGFGVVEVKLRPWCYFAITL